jgi:putative membrane protein insertion efficiency factor
MTAEGVSPARPLLLILAYLPLLGLISLALAKSGLVRCRFEPTCSAYGREAISRYGSPRGFAMAAGRILRCNPWTPGGRDPVP